MQVTNQTYSSFSDALWHNVNADVAKKDSRVYNYVVTGVCELTLQQKKTEFAVGIVWNAYDSKLEKSVPKKLKEIIHSNLGYVSITMNKVMKCEVNEPGDFVC